MRTILIGMLLALSSLSMSAQIELGVQVEVGQPNSLLSGIYYRETKDMENFLKSIDTEGFKNTVIDSLDARFSDEASKERFMSKVLGDGFWTAVSDRADNYTYSEPDPAAKVYKTLDFNEVLRIAKFSNGYALVYKDLHDARFPSITKKAEPMGWVPVSNLLLWTRCPMTDNGVYRKALIVFDPLDPSQIDDLKTGKGRYATLSPDAPSSEKVLLANKIYFVMKETTDAEGNKLVLLSDVSRLEGLYSQHLVGWVEESQLYRWDTRSCLEPEWHKRVRDIYFAKNQANNTILEVYPYPSEEGVQTPLLRKSVSLEDEREDGNVMRFPIVESYENSDCYKVILLGGVGEAKDSIADIGNNSDIRSTGRLNDDTLLTLIGEKAYGQIKDNSSLFVTGFINKPGKEEISLWHPVMFFSETELNGLMADWKLIYSKTFTKGRPDRSDFVDVYVKTAKSLLRKSLDASEETEDSIKAMTLEEITSLFGGTNIQSQSYVAEYTLKDLLDENIVDEEDFNMIIVTFIKKYDRLEQLLKKGDYTMDLGNETYYWVPLEYIP